MRTGRGFERLVNFSDAVVAIAITLLVLPLVDIPGEISDDSSVGQLWDEHNGQFIAFLIGFAVIFTMWKAHHRTLEYFRGYDDVLMWLHALWLLTIVALPFMTELISHNAYPRGAAASYVATLLISVLALELMMTRGRAHRELLTHSDEVDRWLDQPMSYFNAVTMVVVLVLVIVVPQVGLWPLLILTLEGVYERLLAKLRGRRRTAPGK
jgi:uncharacterized membrane protein